MDLVISSDKIGNPLLVELLRKLTDSFGRMGREFYVIGATARDFIMSQQLEINSIRKTKDLDIAIAIPDWSAYDLTTMLSGDQVSFYKGRIEDELAEEEASKLVNQILDNTYGLRYDTVRDAWKVIADVFGMSINEE